MTAYKEKTIVRWKQPIETFVFDTIWKVNDHYVENTARVVLLERSVESGERNALRVKSGRNVWRGIAGALFLLLLLTLLFRRK